MAFKTILTVTGIDQGDRDLELAASLCQESGAHLSLLALLPFSVPVAGVDPGVVSDIWVRQRQTELEMLSGRADHARTFLSARVDSSDIAAQYCEAGEAPDVVGRRGRYADLTVVGPGVLGSDSLRRIVLEGTLFSSGGPLLLVPDETRATLKPKRVLVAWDAGLEASRAVRQALAILKEAAEVRLALVDPVAGEGGHGDEPGADIAAYLARHGVKVTVDRLPSEGRSVEDILTRHAVDTSSGMLVMGAYGHSRLRERLFGGVTRTMLERPPLPVFMAR